jgi:hypothetical protein
VLGHRCKIIEFQTSSSWNQYYVATDINITPATYKDHQAYNWSFYGEKTNGALILKVEHRFKRYTMKGIATSVQKEGNDFKALQVHEDIFKTYCKYQGR